MNEFNNRIAAQRRILQIVNRKQWEKEELLGLSRKAIDRWVSANQIDSESRLVKLIKASSKKLFFLANKSQEQISEEYNVISREIADISRQIELEIS
jgi:5-formaminoimidazole-4-carboxamide-1-beta-D-ribofuranosyl 5'-monophosphate synthetase